MFAWFRKWQRRRKWPIANQLEYLRVIIQDDQRWMAHDPVVMDLCQRYLDILVEEWEKSLTESPQNFRVRHGLEFPLSNKKVQELLSRNPVQKAPT